MCCIAEGEDYLPEDVSLSFPPSSSTGDTVCLNVSIVGNMAYEKPESFFIHLVSEPEVTVSIETAQIDIEDDEGIVG